MDCLKTQKNLDLGKKSCFDDDPVALGHTGLIIILVDYD